MSLVIHDDYIPFYTSRSHFLTLLDPTLLLDFRLSPSACFAHHQPRTFCWSCQQPLECAYSCAKICTSSSYLANDKRQPRNFAESHYDTQDKGNETRTKSYGFHFRGARIRNVGRYHQQIFQGNTHTCAAVKKLEHCRKSGVFFLFIQLPLGKE